MQNYSSLTFMQEALPHNPLAYLAGTLFLEISWNKNTILCTCLSRSDPLRLGTDFESNAPCCLVHLLSKKMKLKKQYKPRISWAFWHKLEHLPSQYLNSRNHNFSTHIIILNIRRHDNIFSNKGKRSFLHSKIYLIFILKFLEIWAPYSSF